MQWFCNTNVHYKQNETWLEPPMGDFATGNPLESRLQWLLVKKKVLQRPLNMDITN